MIQEIGIIPKQAKKVKRNILVRGEVTGHVHRLDGAYEILETPEFLLINIYLSS